MSFRRIYTLILGLQLCLLSYGQSYQKEIYKAYVDYEVNRWLKAAKYVENSNQNQTEKMLNLIHCYYGYTSSLMSLKQNDEAEKIIEKAEILIDKIQLGNKLTSLIVVNVYKNEIHDKYKKFLI